MSPPHRRSSSLASLLLAASLSLSSAPASAADPLEWPDEWPRFSLAEGVVTSVMAATAISLFFVTPPDEANWRGGILFDDAFRDWIVLDSADGRNNAARWSGIGYFGNMVFPVLDVLGAWALRQSPDVAGQMMLINLESFAVSGFVQQFALTFVGRERPLGMECDDNPDYSGMCDGSSQLYKSFYGGHTAFAFTGAGLVCNHHLNLELLGGGWPDYLACGLASGAALATFFLRAAADRHWLSDNLMGVAVGGFAGYVLPNLLHYRWGNRTSAPSLDGDDIALSPMSSGRGFGLQFGARF